MEDPGGLLNFEQNLILSVNIVFNLQVPRPNLRDIVGIPQPRMIWTNLSNKSPRETSDHKNSCSSNYILLFCGISWGSVCQPDGSEKTVTNRETTWESGFP